MHNNKNKHSGRVSCSACNAIVFSDCQPVLFCWFCHVMAQINCQLSTVGHYIFCLLQVFKLFSGIGFCVIKPNVQQAINSLQLTPDNQNQDTVPKVCVILSILVTRKPVFGCLQSGKKQTCVLSHRSFLESLQSLCWFCHVAAQVFTQA